MKKLLKIIVWIFIVLVLLLVALDLSLNQILLKGFNAAAPGTLGVPATLQDAKLSLLRGKAFLQGVHIGNPSGFQTDGLLDLASISIRLDTASLASDTLVINEIAIEGLVVTYEKGLRNSNLGALIESLSTAEEPGTGTSAEKKPEGEKPAKKVIIEKLTITGSRMNFSVTGAMGTSIPIPLPPITLTDLGKEKDGVTVVEAIRRILNAIAGATGTAIVGSAQLINKTFGALFEGVGTIGEASLDAGKAVVGGAADAGKAVLGGTTDAGKALVGGAANAGKAIGGAAVDAGKAVGGALQSVNPFKK